MILSSLHLTESSSRIAANRGEGGTKDKALNKPHNQNHIKAAFISVKHINVQLGTSDYFSDSLALQYILLL